MALRKYTFPITIDTSSADIIADFFVPALSASVRYDRGVGYFSAGWLRLTAEGMLVFAENGGRARWVTSPILDVDDWNALQQGAAARYDLLLREVLQRNITSLEDTLQRDTLSALAWMVADEILDFRLALPRNKLIGGEFHDKFGVFTDAEGYKVSFNGSYNESIQGTRNYESLKVFSSWEEPYAPLAKAEHERFERLWANLDPNVQVYTLPDAARASILKLRSKERPYKLSTPSILSLPLNEPRIPPELVLRAYQITAIDSWVGNNYRGILEMATGTGKTKTALSALVRLYNQKRRLAVIISVPYQHLVDQWSEDVELFGIHPILAYKEKKRWNSELHKQVMEYNHQDRRVVCVITTHKTFSDSDFQEAISKIIEPSLFIADEVHHLGAQRSRNVLPQTIPARLGLSATPDRWYNESGTATLRQYFGKTVFELNLKNAIAERILVPYTYHPQLVELTLDEMETYQKLSDKIARLNAMLDKKYDAKLAAQLETLNFKRVSVLNGASNKLEVLRQLVRNTPDGHHTLFYCAPEQIKAVAQLVGWEEDWQIGRFTAEESTEERQSLLAEFDSGALQGLVAMKCLDEGVDVPSTQTAYILASSTNPREFIQRRGRVLRKAVGKNSATIYDFIVVPPQGWYQQTGREADKGIIERELRRFAEFADSASNKHQSMKVVRDIASQYGIYL